MNLGGKYIQYSKVFTSLAGIAFFIQVAATLLLIWMRPEISDSLIAVLKETTGFVGLVFGCYTGNSAVEKVVTNKPTTKPAAAGKKNEG